jgi:WD40 repeat protein
MEPFKNENLLKLVAESFTLSKAKHFFTQSKSRIISKILLIVLNLKKFFISTGKSKHIIKYGNEITSVIRFTDNNIITTSEDGNLKIISMDNYNCLLSLPGETYDYILSMILLPNENILYSTLLNAIIEVDPRKDYSCVNFVHLDDYNCPMNLLSLTNGHIAFSAEEDEDTHILILDFNNKHNIIKLFTEKDAINSLISLNGDRFACATVCSGIIIWDTGNNGYTCSKILNGHSNDSVRCLLYINEYDSLVSGSHITIEIWDINNYESLSTIKEGAMCLLYLPNGYFATSGLDKKIKIWNLVGYQCVSVFEGSKYYVNFLLVLKDNRIVSASEKEIIIWNKI